MNINQKDILFFDVEANGLLYEADTIHCIVTWLDSDGLRIFADKEPPDFGSTLDGTTQDGITYIIGHANTTRPIAGHNIAGYDLPLFAKLYPNLMPKTTPPYLQRGSGYNVLDTYIISCLLWPQQQEHGLEYWGKQLGLEKQEHTDWTQLSTAMIKRCASDIRINLKLWGERISPKLGSHEQRSISWDMAIDLEQEIQQIHAQQELTGVRYNILKAVALSEELKNRADQLRGELIPQAPQRVVNAFKASNEAEVYQGNVLMNPLESGKSSVVKKPFLKSGKFSKMVLDHFGSEEAAKAANIKDKFSRIRHESINLDSTEQVKNWLLQLGWKPTQWNFNKETRQRTSPKLSEDSYASLPEGLGRKLAEYNIVQHRLGTIINQKGKERGGLWTVRDDGRVPAEAFTCGTPTSRYRHKNVICNIPSSDAPYGKEIRSLFCVPDEWWMAGLDLKGIEIRMIAHYCNIYNGGHDLTKAILSGDFHDMNAQLWDVSRGQAKGGLYALCYGCSPPKLAETLGKPMREGEMHYDRFWAKYPPLKELVEDLKRTYSSKGYILGLDGRRLSIRQDRKLLNSLIQGSSAVLFKTWMKATQMHRDARPTWRRKVHQLIAYHDELQFEIRDGDKEYAEHCAKEIAELAMEVGMSYNIRVPIEADYRIGKSWFDTH